MLLIISTTFVQHRVWAQHSFSANAPLHQSVITQWTGDNGLISNNITSAIQSQSGFIWITTYNGIMRFDGRKVDVYDRSLIPFFNTDSFYAVYEDQAGTLWFASQGSGLIKYTGGKFEQIDPEGKFFRNPSGVFSFNRTEPYGLARTMKDYFTWRIQKSEKWNTLLLMTLPF